jgi:hypothetical protein
MQRLILTFLKWSQYMIRSYAASGTGPFPSRVMVSGPFTILGVVPFESSLK